MERLLPLSAFLRSFCGHSGKFCLLCAVKLWNPATKEERREAEGPGSHAVMPVLSSCFIVGMGACHDTSGKLFAGADFHFS